MSSNGFDMWRSNYLDLDTKVHADMYSESYSRDPGHATFSGRAVRVFLSQVGGTPVVAEIGGRNGALAKAALDSTSAIKKWINYDICPSSMAGCVTDDPRYVGKLMTDFRWWRRESIEGDALIMSHFIEHISDEDATDLVRRIPKAIQAVHVQAPITMRGPMDWTGFNGAHILTMGWIELNDLFEENGFRSMVAYDGASWRRR